jgi:phosphate transport system substrate-binding protein
MKGLLTMRLAPIAVIACAACLTSVAQAPEASLPHYVSHPVASPAADAPYLLPDKTIYVLANDLVGPYFEALDEVFTKTHPNIRIHLNPLGSEPAIAALTSNISAFTPMGRDGIRQDLDGFRALHGFAPQSFLVGYDQSPDPDIFPPGKVPSAIWINAKNPLPKITVELAARIFTTGAPGGDITHWSQLGVKGEWGKREIHIYLPAKRDSAFLFIDGTILGGRPWSPRIEWLDASTDVMTAIAQDPFSIGIIGFWPPDSGWDRQSDLGSQPKLLAMAENDDAHYSHAGVGDVYPLTGSIRVYFNAAPGKPLEPWMSEYMRLALSQEGQDLLKSLAAENGYIVLEPAKVKEELAKLK